MNKKAIAILGAIFLLIVGTLGFLIYSKYSADNKDQQAQNPPDNNPVAPNPFDPNSTTTPLDPIIPDPQPSNTAFSKLGDDQVVSPILFYNGNGIAFFDAGGRLYQADFDESAGSLQLKNKRSLDVQAAGTLTQILWPSRGDHFMAVYADSQGKNSYSFYNSDTRVFTDLPRQVTSLDWAPSGDKIFYIWTENGKSSLNFSNPDTSSWQQIADMWETDDEIRVSPDGSSIAYYQAGNPGDTNKITMTTPDGKVWKDLVKEGYNLGILWSPDSQKILFAKRDRQTGQYGLWYYSLSSGETKPLNLFTTVDKVIWDRDSNTVYAAVPMSGGAGTGTLTSDTFFKLNTQTLERQEFKPDTGMVLDGRSLVLANNSDKLFFKNAQDGGLYYLDLTK